MEKVKVLALDPSFRNTGYAVMELGKIKDTISETGVIKTEARAKKSAVRAADQTLEQIQILVTALKELVAKHKPAMLIAELPSSGGKSARAIASMAIAQAVCGALVAYENLPAEWVTPSANKKGLTGIRNASKDQMQKEVLSRYPSLKTKYTHAKGQYKGQLRGEFEHIADAIGAFETVAQVSPMVKLLRNKEKI